MREKLIKLLSQVQDYGTKHTNEQWSVTVESKCNETIADHLIANGVTVQKWIPVSERLPETDGRYLCNYHFGNHRYMTFTRVLDFYATDAVPHFQHTLGDTTMKVTHWMPLPEPPKGE